MTWSFHREAEHIEYYEARSPGLGRSFALEVRAAIGRMVEFPDAWPEIEPSIRRVLTSRFPFGVLYARDGETLSDGQPDGSHELEGVASVDHAGTQAVVE